MLASNPHISGRNAPATTLSRVKITQNIFDCTGLLYRAPRLKTKQRAGSMLLGAELAIGWWLSALLMNFARSTRATHFPADL